MACRLPRRRYGFGVPLGVREIVAVVGEFSSRLEANRAALNELNVFPVADNDTGSNMVHTVDSIRTALCTVRSLDDAARVVENAALDGRGNSGLIIGQFLAGFFSASTGESIELADGLAEGARWARRAVATPVEGTMLTVADVASASSDLPLRSLVDVVAAAVEATPSQLAVLAERDVVDSGAAGLLLFFEALNLVIGDSAGPAGGVEPGLIVCNVGMEDVRLDESNHHGVSRGATQHDLYEIQFRFPSALVSADELRTLLIAVGTDVVIASSAHELAAHVHAVDPHVATAAISAALETRPEAQPISYDVEPIVELRS